LGLGCVGKHIGAELWNLRSSAFVCGLVYCGFVYYRSAAILYNLCYIFAGALKNNGSQPQNRN